MNIWVALLLGVFSSVEILVCGEIKEILIPPDPDSPEFFNCMNHNMECPSWAHEGGCHKEGFMEWMVINCPLACNTCDLANPATRCTRKMLNMSETPAFATGQMNVMLSEIEKRYQETHKVTVLSRQPWVIAIDNFLTDDEIAALQAHATPWDQLSGVEHVDEHGHLEPGGRTSSKAWCNRDCLEQELVQGVLSKVEKLLTVPRSHYEHMQVCKNIIEHYIEITLNLHVYVIVIEIHRWSRISSTSRL